MPTKAELQARVAALEKENAAIKAIYARAERELNNRLLSDEIPPKKVPCLVQRLMRFYRVPWEVFWCKKHQQWIDELDSVFPYHMEGNKCPGCKNED